MIAFGRSRHIPNLKLLAAPAPWLPYLLANLAGLYAGVTLVTLRRRWHKEKHWDEHPGEWPPIQRPFFYLGTYLGDPPRES
ncbi:hypothetical protein CAOG_08739 [Capsaspora owczarzaki ATCC 30864]|uniref:Uncharacterized protein n=1 Tax=Capsaspora owczarzaki (strain ATCC 30864) TaxID=595528 RepID=A0A0D2WQ47_CAPO3|nr:hypothetical protein CAOG_08739 [Capsaspora owczarzaki ATCC 30864]KJE92998.1 hypothetical protein CAOG_008739 [Capsaspora owczarzaki ATCC 30864]|eukprot:XP_011270359.1 hypothetical protein CAOG_08739 [Capsaspora owczarzaki ATCC 30864]